MPRDGKEVRRRLQLAALELYRDQGYDQTTAADIAARAGVTERTFFRHFPDKREVLFDGDAAFSDALVSAVRHVPRSVGPWDTLLLAFKSVEPIFVEHRSFSEPRQRIIGTSAALQERAMAKTKLVIAALASVLRERGIADHQADLAAQIGVTTFSYAVATWFGDGSIDLGDHIVRAFREVHNLSSSTSKRKIDESPGIKRSVRQRAVAHRT